MRLLRSCKDAVCGVFNPPPLVTIVRLSGLIAPGSGLRRGGLNLAHHASLLKTAFAPSRLAAVALVINSPGGSPVQSALIAHHIRQHAAEKKVPVLGFVEDVAASGGYWLAAAADEIFADPSSIIGSIGVISAGFGFTEAMRRLGIERRVHTQGEHKHMLDPFMPEKPDDIERLLALQASIHQEFKAWVCERRQERLRADHAALFNGDIWTGRQALELGLVDGLGEMRSVLRGRFGEKVRMRIIGGHRPSWLRFVGLEGRGSPVDQILATVEERLEWSRWGLG